MLLSAKIVREEKDFVNTNKYVYRPCQERFQVQRRPCHERGMSRERQEKKDHIKNETMPKEGHIKMEAMSGGGPCQEEDHVTKETF
jgi:hypothetical protein